MACCVADAAIRIGDELSGGAAILVTLVQMKMMPEVLALLLVAALVLAIRGRNRPAELKRQDECRQEDEPAAHSNIVPVLRRS